LYIEFLLQLKVVFLRFFYTIIERNQMILRKLAIFGFKSFAEKTELDFGSGMTAVIGPNGCGKSNVVDAIRWVLGEQKVTLLRSANMQDVIFSGTQQRQPLNMAEVVLTIENTKGILPVEYSEVAISRRIFRNGESEYRINKVPCRLRDIHNLFLDTGVGSSAYTTIERAMIDSILSDKAEERRTLFEEAAGIGKYKQRRKESLRQLDKTKQDLLRINDQVQEVDRQVRMLARHVEKARRYRTYRDDLKTLELGYWGRQFRILGETIKIRGQQLDEMIGNREVLRSAIATQESRIEKMRLAALEKEKDLEIASRTVGESNEKIIGIDRDLSVAMERLRSLNDMIGGLDRDVVAIEAQIEENTMLRTKLEKCIIERESELAKFDERTASINAEIGLFDGRLQAKRDEADALSREQIELINRVGEARNSLSTHKSHLTNTMEQRDRNRREIESLETRIEEYREAATACRTQLMVMDEENRNLLMSRERLIARVDGEDLRYQEFVEREKRLEAQIDASQERRKFLEGLDAAFEGYEGGVKELLTKGFPGMKGIVADLIRVKDDGSVGLVERALGPAVQTVVFDTEENLQAAVRHLRDEKVGAACMIALDRIAWGPAAEPVGGVAMRSILEPVQGYEALAEHLLSSVVITESGEEAISFSRRQGSAFTFIGRDGVVCRGDGTVVAGESKKEKAGILQRKLQIENLAGAVERSKKEHATVLHDKDSCVITRDEAKKALVEVDEKLNRGQRSSQEQETNIRHYESELQIIGEKVQGLHTETAGFTVRIEGLEQQITRSEAELAAEQNRYDGLEAQVEEARAAVRAMEDERRAKAECLKNTELEVQGLSNRVSQDRQDVERLTKENTRSFERKRQKIEEKQKAVADIASLEHSLVSLRQDQAAQIEQRTALEKVHDGVREEYNGRLMEVEELRKKVKTDQTQFEEISNQVHTVELDQTRDEQEQRRIRERMWESYEVDLTAPAAPIREVTDGDDAVQQNIEMLRERIRRVGEVNMAAFEDYETESKRLKELTTQRDDLQEAVDDLGQAIKKLDKEARVQFIATFEQVQKHFSDMFTTLFEGGEASLQLEENADPLEAAIHINVRPAGKKMRGVQMLSAGERALTAISLLFALYLVKPSAYCILDELDAPLDEANTIRFLGVLRKFADETQFIVITHNKRTMEAADVLYGVTQLESGVSTIVSVRFEEAVRQAA
jgi:chromosome segregation protein